MDFDEWIPFIVFSVFYLIIIGYHTYRLDKI